MLLNVYDRPLIEAALAALRRIQNEHPSYAHDHDLVAKEAVLSQEEAEAERIEDERRRAHAAKVPKEPPEGAAGAAKICVHLGDNQVVWRRFDSTVDTLQDLLNFVKSLKGAPDSPRLENITQLPSCAFDVKSQLGLSLHYLDLWPAGHIRVSCAA